MMKQHFQMLAAYNGWANKQLFDAVATLSESEYRQDAGLFYKSVHATLNHVLGNDRLWMKRFTGEGDHPKSPDAILYLALSDLRIARIQEDARIFEWIEGLSPSDVAGRFVFHNMSDMRTISQRLAPALAHLFNHQTFNRGQVYAALTMLKREAPVLDMMSFQKSEAGRRFS
ncbi:hypothetical protein MP213Fo_05580 [Pseudochrobactrum sp. MP213Fo]